MKTHAIAPTPSASLPLACQARCIEACPSVRAVATFQRFPPSRGGLVGFVESLPAEACETTWTAPKDVSCEAEAPGSTVHIYLRADESATSTTSEKPAAATLAASPPRVAPERGESTRENAQSPADRGEPSAEAAPARLDGAGLLVLRKTSDGSEWAFALCR